MATSKSYFVRQNYRFLDTNHHTQLGHGHDSVYELDESDIYNNSMTTTTNSPDFRKAVVTTPRSKKSTSASARERAVGTPASLPVNIPDWSKILKDEYKNNRRSDVEDDDDVDGEDCFDGGERVPPHEFLARNRIASFSVHEGIGRTLKGRDLSRVRNAIWQKTGFED